MSNSVNNPLPRTRRKLAVALALFFVCGLLWLLSMFQTHTVRIGTINGQQNVVQSTNGFLVFGFTRFYLGPNESFIVRHTSNVPHSLGDTPVSFLYARITDEDPDEVPLHLFDFIHTEPPGHSDWVRIQPTETLLLNDRSLAERYARFTGSAELLGVAVPYGARGPMAVLIAVPWVLVIFGLLVAIAIRWRRIRRLASRLRQQRCVHCGYDLRESPERCSECGEPVPEPVVPRAIPWRRYAWSMAALALALLFGYLAGRTREVQHRQFAGPMVDPVAARLEGVRRSVHLNHVPLREAIQKLREIYGAQIVVNWRRQGIDDNREWPTSVDMDDAQLVDVLEALPLLNDLAVVPDIQDGLVVLVSMHETQGHYRVYDVRRLTDIGVELMKADNAIVPRYAPLEGESKELSGEAYARAMVHLAIQKEIEPKRRAWGDDTGVGADKSEAHNEFMRIRETAYGHLLVERALTALEAEWGEALATLKREKKGK